MKPWQSSGNQGITILLTEQNVLRALQLANRGYILQEGRVIIEDTAENLMKNLIW